MVYVRVESGLAVLLHHVGDIFDSVGGDWYRVWSILLYVVLDNIGKLFVSSLL